MKRRGRGRGVRGWAMRLLALLALVAALLLVVAIRSAIRVARIDVTELATKRPGETALMRERAREAQRAGARARVRRTWKPLESISPHLRRAVLIAEDDAFYTHRGLDWNEIEASTERNWRAGRIIRGGSTITQQLAKNLWLGSSRNPVRKFEELMLAVRLERALSKRRILELYLNVIEWGDGVYGAEEAARHWYGVSAADLSSAQAIALSAVIINPRRFSPVAPTRRIERRIRLITQRLARRGQLPAPAPPSPPAGPPADSLWPAAPDSAQAPDSVAASSPVSE